MHLDDIMKNYKPLYPHSGLWEDTFKMIDEDPIDSELVQELLAELEKNGEFREPIILTTYEDYLQAEAEYKYAEGESTDPYVPHVNEGTHRLYAHYLSTHKEVKVQYGWNPDLQEDYPILASKVSVPQSLSSEKVYEAWDRFRSFKLNDEVWVTSELVSTVRNNFHILWVFGTKKVEQLSPYILEINEKLLSIAQKMELESCTAKTGIISSELEDDMFFDRQPAQS